MALISERSFRSKSELLDVVSGYEGSPTTRERMFERDKEELRSIGVPIEVKVLDPLFEDQMGYRVPKERFLISIPNLTPQESLILAAATYLALPGDLRNEKNELKRRLYSLAVYPHSARKNTVLEADIWKKFSSYSSVLLQSISKALFSSRLIEFRYLRQSDGELTNRKIAPHGLFVKSDEIFMIGFDIDREAFRTFNLDYIVGEIDILQAEFDRRLDFVIDDHFRELVRSTIQVTIEVPTEFETRILALGGRTIAHNEGSVEMKFDMGDQETFFRSLLTATNRFRIIEPEEIKNSFSLWLKALLDGK